MAHYTSGPILEYGQDTETPPVGLIAKLLVWFRRNKEVIAWVVIFEVIGTVLGLTTDFDGEWYTNLDKSPLDPPPALFGIVWPFLYAFLAVVGYQLYNAEVGSAKSKLFVIFAVQQIFNWLWIPFFITLEEPEISLIIITVIATLTSGLVIELAKLGAWEGFLLVPYLIWILFATHLNTYITRNNC